MKKRILALALALVMGLALAACNGESKPADDKDTAAISKETLKIGLILIGDEADAYNKNHVEGMKAAMTALEVPETALQIKANVAEGADTEVAVRELVESGCQAVFVNSFGHEVYMLNVAAEYPAVQFFSATGVKSATDELTNTHNYFTRIFEARYLSGIVAGLKTETNKIGYVAAKPYAEVISGYTAFYLGAKSVNPDVEMYVNYTNEWSDAGKEATNAKALIDLGCDVLSQHSDTSAPATTAQQNGVFVVGYNADMIPVADKAALISARIDWSIYYEYALDTLLAGEEIAQDWCKGLAENAVYLSDLNEAIAAEGTIEAIETAKAGLLDGSVKAFAGPLYDNNGAILVAEGDAYDENATSSAPSWDKIVKGITVLS